MDSTVLTYISTISYTHRLASVPDPTQSASYKLAFKGYAKIHPSLDLRVPITLPLLEQIIHALNHTISIDYRKRLMKAMCATAFFAALRVGEMTFSHGQNISNIIKL